MKPGDRLGPYEIVEPIGAGGMGEVWKARDTRLNRIVAVKVSKQKFSDRFEREAHAVAALNHPHICQVYDVGPDYLVMEYVEGKPLHGPVPLQEALTLAGQILDALDAAHRKGITHRDLKPGNILVGKAGIKVLDFGLAKIEHPRTSEPVTETRPLTDEGAILGTLQYMSPEQVEGQEADARSDIFAFGLVLYELITGKQAFRGKSRASLIASILKEQPHPLHDLQPLAPVALERVVQTCLEKDPDKRWQSAREVRHALEWISAEPRPAPAPIRKQTFGRIAVAVLVLALALAVWGWWRTRPVEQAIKPLMRLDVDLGPDVSLGSPVGSDVIISPDGTRLVYVSGSRLFTRRLDQPKATELAGTEGAAAPFFSPDGQWVGFFVPGKLKKVSVEGGDAVELFEGRIGAGGSWGDDGSIIANVGGVLSRIPAAGGAPTPITKLDVNQGDDIRDSWPQILPGGRAVLFTESRGPVANADAANIEVLSLEDHKTKMLKQGGTYGRYLPSGHLVYLNRGTLFAVPFDLNRLELRGTPAPVLEQIAYSPVYGSAQLDFSRSGTLVYRSGAPGGALVTVEWLDAAGNMQPLLAKPGPYLHPRVSPDGQRLALELREGPNTDVWMYDLQRDTLTRVTFSGTPNGSPLWSPDGRYIVFLAQGQGLSSVRADGASKSQLLTQTKNVQLPQSFTPDGKRLSFFQGGNPDAPSGIWTLPVDRDDGNLRAGKPEIFLQNGFPLRDGAFSPDGRWIAYTSGESGHYEIYVRAFPDRGSKWQMSNSGGIFPKFSSNGRELFFEADKQIMVAPYIVKGDAFVADKPRVWSDKRLGGPGGGFWNYDVAPDGKRIVALMPVDAPDEKKAQNQVIFLQNFFDELRRRVPITK